MLACTSSAGAAEQPSTVSLSASAYGSTASVGPVTAGKTARFTSCSTTPGTAYGNDVAVTDLGCGLVQATTISATSTSELVGVRLRSSGSTTITGLTIAGLPKTVPAGVSSRLDIPGVATSTFNRQASASTTVSRELTADALRIDLLKDNKLGLAAGSVVVGSATSGASGPTSFAGSGMAYGTMVDVGGVVASGASAYVSMPCGGTGGAVLKNKVLGLSVPGVVTSRAVASIGQSIEGTGSTTAVFRSTVAGIDLLGGAVAR